MGTFQTDMAAQGIPCASSVFQQIGELPHPPFIEGTLKFRVSLVQVQRAPQLWVGWLAKLRKLWALSSDRPGLDFTQSVLESLSLSFPVCKMGLIHLPGRVFVSWMRSSLLSGCHLTGSLHGGSPTLFSLSCQREMLYWSQHGTEKTQALIWILVCPCRNNCHTLNMSWVSQTMPRAVHTAPLILSPLSTSEIDIIYRCGNWGIKVRLALYNELGKNSLFYYSEDFV